MTGVKLGTISKGKAHCCTVRYVRYFETPAPACGTHRARQSREQFPESSRSGKVGQNMKLFSQVFTFYKLKSILSMDNVLDFLVACLALPVTGNL